MFFRVTSLIAVVLMCQQVLGREEYVDDDIRELSTMEKVSNSIGQLSNLKSSLMDVVQFEMEQLESRLDTIHNETMSQAEADLAELTQLVNKLMADITKYDPNYQKYLQTFEEAVLNVLEKARVSQAQCMSPLQSKEQIFSKDLHSLNVILIKSDDDASLSACIKDCDDGNCRDLGDSKDLDDSNDLDDSKDLDYSKDLGDSYELPVSKCHGDSDELPVSECNGNSQELGDSKDLGDSNESVYSDEASGDGDLKSLFRDREKEQQCIRSTMGVRYRAYYKVAKSIFDALAANEEAIAQTQNLVTSCATDVIMSTAQPIRFLIQKLGECIKNVSPAMRHRSARGVKYEKFKAFVHRVIDDVKAICVKIDCAHIIHYIRG